MTQDQYQKALAIQQQLHDLDIVQQKLTSPFSLDIQLIELSTKFNYCKLFKNGLGNGLFDAKLKDFKLSLLEAIESKTAELEQEFKKL